MSCRTPSRDPIRRWPIATVGLLLGSVLWTALAQDSANLPSESELPDSGQASLSGDGVPTEAELPGDAATDEGDRRLPGEDQLPDAAAASGDDDDRTSAALPGQVQPLLRLDFDGHTGLIQTLDVIDGGTTLVSAGQDKDVHVWRRIQQGNRGWIHVRTIRWPITRGPRGQIYCASQNENLVAFAGYGAFGGMGEIRVVDTASGELAFDPFVGKHRQVITSLAWSPDESKRLASVDGSGQLVVWSKDEKTGLWGGDTLVQDDLSRYGEQTASGLAPYRVFVPTTFSGPTHVVVPEYAGVNDGGVIWHLSRIDLRDKSRSLLTDVDHQRHVVDCVASSDGTVLVSCDWEGSVAVWRFEPGAEPTASVITGSSPLVMDMDHSGRRLLVGTRLIPGEDPADAPRARLQLWNLETAAPTLMAEKDLPDNVRTASLDWANREAIVAQGSRIDVFRLNADGTFAETPPQVLDVPAKPILKVAMHKDLDRYEVAYAAGTDRSESLTWNGVFDLSASKLVGRGEIDPDDYLPAQRTSSRWMVGAATDSPSESRWRLFEGEIPRGVLPLRQELHGVPTAICTLPEPPSGSAEPGENPNAGAVIVGTNGQNGIYVFAANGDDPPKLLRQFRGHSGTIESISTSADGRYLVSGSEDSTIAVWNLQDLFDVAGTSVNLWGVDFEVDGERLIAAEVREDGPLYFRGVRGGDRLMSIEWIDRNGEMTTESNPDRVFDHLSKVSFDELVVFRFSRMGRPRPGFQSYPAWRPLARLFVDEAREWAFWTPAGYYDASFNGHQRFGWQINQGLKRKPDFFRAAQFRKVLERPDIMQRLLASGSLPAAMRAAPEGQDAIVNQYRNKPTIRLVDPQPGATINGDTMTVTAEITVPLGAELVDPRAFVSGVPAVSRRRSASEKESTSVYEWKFRLPSDRLLQLEILAATQAEAIDRVIVNLEHSAPRRATRPRLHVLAIGAGHYPDPQIPSLEFAAAAARDVTELFRAKSSPLYRVSADRLIDRDATRPLWRIFAQQAAERLSETVSPDDLVVMYLCGHGIRDRRTDQWYFVTADARYDDLQNDEYARCLSFSDLAALSKLPCRKLAILDSCHSGAVQPLMRRDDLKSALRFLQDDVVITLTASEGDEEAAEQREERMGRFTSKLVEALEGAADDGDNVVTLNEVIEYVTETVSDESEQEGMPQHPTASPQYLLRAITLPLTATSAP